MAAWKIVLVKDADAPGGQAFWSPERGWHELPKGVKTKIELTSKVHNSAATKG